MIDTPRCNALESNPLDSFDYRAWMTLARELERELLSSQPEAVRSDGGQAMALLYLLAKTGPIMRWKEYEDRGEERIPCYIQVETAKAIAEFFPDSSLPQLQPEGDK